MHLLQDTGSLVSSGADLTPIFVIAGIWSVVGIAFYVWYLWSLSRLFPLLGIKGAWGWIPVWNQWQLIQRGGLPGWMVLLALVPGVGGLIVLVVTIIAMQRINTEFGKGAGMTVLGVVLPPLWAMLLTSHITDGRYGAAAEWAPVNPDARADASGGIMRGLPHANVPPLQHGYGAQGVPQPQTQPQPQNGLFPPQSQGAPQHAGTPQGFAQQGVGQQGVGQQGVATQQGAQSQPVPPQNNWGFSNTTEGAYERLAAEGAWTPGAAPLGSQVTQQPFSWPAPHVDPAAVSAAPPQAPAPQAPAPQVQAPQTPAQTPQASAPQASAPQAQAPQTPTQAPQALAPQPVAPQSPVAVPPEQQVIDSPSAGPSPAVPMPGVPSSAASSANIQTPAAQQGDFRESAPATVGHTSNTNTGNTNTSKTRPTQGGTPSQGAPAAAEAAPLAPRAPVVPAAHTAVVAPPGLGLAGVNTLAQSGPSSVDDSEDDLTVVVRRETRWGLELPDGEVLELIGHDVVVGRRPEATGGHEVLKINDATRTLSKSHVRMRRSGEVWTVEDLHSTNGVALIDETGAMQTLEPGHERAATDHLLIGTLEVRLVRMS